MSFVFFIFGVAISCIAWWLAGFNFDARGVDALNCFASSFFAGLFGIVINKILEITK